MLTSFSLLFLAIVTSATPLTRRADIAHDAVVGFPQTVPAGLEGSLMLKYQPYLQIVDGCVPYPAVDKNGQTSGGLSPTGDPAGDCNNSTGQVYARAAVYDGKYAILYAWYFPKDEPSEVESLVGAGHRNDWESAVVWLDGKRDGARLQGVAASYHGDYRTNKSPSLRDNAPLLKYYTAYNILDHSMGFTSTVGTQQPLVALGSMPDVARQALTNKNWGKANVPMIEKNFQNNLAEAKL